ncbi:hypothetical protein [Empedobacter brevis]|nr:hypothetical protein [Empedobacter brevis]
MENPRDLTTIPFKQFFKVLKITIMKALLKLFLLIVFFAGSATIFAKPNSIRNGQLLSTNFENKETVKSPNPINLYGAGVLLAVVLCAYRFRKKII